MTSKLSLEAGAALAARGLTLDAAQQQALTQLSAWFEARLKPRRWFSRTPRGAYFYGGVGRGKSMLLDALFHTAPLAQKRRVHVHALLQNVQNRLLKHAGLADPIVRVAKELATEARLWFFDEFHVHDIGDAILLGRLLEQLFKHDCILLFSSNYAPDALCPNPLYSSRFKPFVAQIKRHSLVLEMDAGCDYRPRTERRWGRYIAQSSAAFSQTQEHSATHIKLGRRKIAVQGIDEKHLWVRFSSLCQQPLATSDYLEICARFTRVLLSDVPAMASCTLDEQQRLINFIDIAYDTGIELWLHSELALDELCAASKHGDFTRTHSRLAQLTRAL